jgi:hypothetical protein
VTGIVLAAVIAAEPATHAALQRHAGIVTTVGAVSVIGGAVALGLGISKQRTEITVGGAALIAFGISALVLSVVAWLWPEEVPVRVAEVPSWRVWL